MWKSCDALKDMMIKTHGEASRVRDLQACQLSYREGRVRPVWDVQNSSGGYAPFAC